MAIAFHKNFGAASFGRQLTLTFAIGIFCLALFSSLVISWWGTRRIRDNFVDQGLHVTEGFARQSALSLLYASADNAREPAAATLAFPDVAFVEIRDNRGTRLLSLGDWAFAHDIVAEARSRPISKVAIEYENSKAWLFAAPVYAHSNSTSGEESPFIVEQPQPELLGYVRVAISKDTSRKMMKEIFLANGTISLIFAAGLLIVLQFLTRRMTRPLTQLSEAMYLAETGDSKPRASVQGPEEVVRMAHAFNKMMGVLEERENELRAARDSALESAHAKTEFATTVSHEIRTPMNGVLGMLEVLRGMSLSSKQREYVEIARNSADALLALINNVLDFSKMEANKLELEKVSFDLCEIIEQVISLMAGQAQTKNLDLGYVIAPNVPRALCGDPTRLRQVLVNLIGNAVKFTEQGQVALRVSLAEESIAGTVRLHVEVSDTGIGISAEAHEHIFESFSQVDSSTTRKYGGSGLGLTICRQIVEAMSGQIGLTSAPGDGSTFWFTVPLELSSAEPASPDRLDLQNTRALLVAKSPILLDFLEQSLSAWGVPCTRVADGEQAMMQLRDALEHGESYGLALIDMAYPGNSGIEAARQICGDRSLSKTRLIMMTPYGEIHDERGVRGWDADAYVNKPLRYGPLLEAVREALTISNGSAVLARCVHEPTSNKMMGRRVLVAEDNCTNQIVAIGLLARLGCVTDVVSNGQEAVAAVQKNSYDAVLMDCNMPEMDGYQACARIRELESATGRHVPIIAMTANARQAEVNRCRSVGMDDHIAKPLLLDLIRQALERVWSEAGAAMQTASSTDPTANTNTDAIDGEIMLQLRDALGMGVTAMVNAYLEDTPAYLDQLQKAVAAGDFEAIRTLAHSISGSSSNLGATKLADLSAKLEDAGRSRSQEGLPWLLSACVDEYARVAFALQSEVESDCAVDIVADDGAPLVLVVDDDRSTRAALRHALERDGFRVRVASNGEQALGLLDEITPEVILMDAIMPVMDGFAATRKLTQTPGGAEIPVLMITRLDDEASIDLAFAAGATDYIPKPIHFPVLTQRVKRIVDARRAEKHVRRLAYHDPLTGLPNRVRFLDHVAQRVQRSGGDGRQLAVLFLDLDRFKFINDTLGHDVGDQLLKAVALRITHAVRGGDMVARLGGDEFTVVLEDIANVKVASVVAEKICKSLGEPFFVAGHEIFVGASIGISVYPADGTDVGTLLKHADTAMYRAKKNGNGYLYYEEGMGNAFSKKLLLENALRRALEREELAVFYQPKLNLARSCIVGAEALVRWQHPSEGLISPADFIPLAEETGLIIPIGEWVMRTACAQVKKWLEAGFPELSVAVNLSVRQIVQTNFVDVVARVMRETGIPPHLLELEITESVLMEHAKEAMLALQQLREMGVTLAVDDFGTGYSSFGYLKRLPISVLKIDRSFVRDITTDPDDAAIVAGIIALAQSLRLQVVAEGVETEEQEAFLRQKGCDMIQGYYLSQPLPLAQFEQRVLLTHFPMQSSSQFLKTASSY